MPLNSLEDPSSFHSNKFLSTKLVVVTKLIPTNLKSLPAETFSLANRIRSPQENLSFHIYNFGINY